MPSMEWISISRAELSKCLDIKMGKKGWKKKKGNKNKFLFGLLLDVGVREEYDA